MAILGCELTTVSKLRVSINWMILCLSLVSCATTPHQDEDPAPQAMVTRVEQALNEGDLAFAERELQTLRQRFPNDLAVLLTSARLHALGNRSRELESVSQQILHIDPANGFALEQLGLLRLAAGDLEAAENTLTRAVAVEPLRWRAWNGLGVVADFRARFEEAGSHFDRALEIVPGHPKLLANLGWSRLLAGNVSEAESLLRRALEMDPEATTTEANLAFSIAMQGRYDEAMILYTNQFSRAVAANNIGYAAALRDDRAAANKYLSMALELMPSYYRKAVNNLALVDN